MSADDKALSTGKTVLEYVASKRRLATLQAEAARVADKLGGTAAALRDNSADPSVSNHFIGLATLEKLPRLMNDLQAETRRYEDLLKMVRTIGLDG